MKIGTKQIALLTVALALLVVGYKHEDLTNLWKGNTAQEGTATPSATGKNDDEIKDVFVNSTLPFDSNRLDRDSARAKTKEAYELIAGDKTASEATRTEAYNKIMNLTQQAEKEAKVESLIREKGFTDAFACFSDLGELDVLIKTEALTEIQVTQIADIIIRYTDLDYSAIHVRKVA